MSSLDSVVKAGAVLTLALLVVPAVAASPPPDNLSGSYDADTQTFLLTWGYDPDATVDGFRVFIDGTAVGDVTDQEYEDDLTGFAGGARTYQVAAIVDSEQGPRSEELVAFFSPGGPIFPCAVYGGTIDLNDMPPVSANVNPQCLPWPIDGEGE